MSYERKQVGKCCVDSGQMMLVDPAYVEDADYQRRPFTHEDNGDGTFNYQGAMNASNPAAGQLKNKHGAPVAVVCSTGWGDGTYPVFVDVAPNGRVAGMHILFMEEEYAREDYDLEDDEEDEDQEDTE